ncbi:TonB-dependent receptor [Colwellia sp. 4_MG-2023]|uniref:TonB-dependent receptor n=1 Tax=unclassified Colwellia TaxID=196834 RepID=UPI0026E3D22C|nr:MULTISPECIES: TonB-dependent receptor [unclassified Colwellia]MDO6508651.1 TonB-dependent receptor [Colwellia sp. 5_MG-2023]MDO6557305.1 TonB-dependent receptor [Colwellia sp. 4_MG-2023]
MKLNKISAVFNKCQHKNKNLTIFGAALTAMLTFPTYAAEETQLENQSVNEVEVIEVRGLFGSLAESARQKRFDSRIVDAIVAEDIGKLPDNNIAEALQRVTGVSISTDFGVGESVTIRGISQNRVELNGRSTSGSGRGGISLDDFPSSFLKTVEVIKSPTAEMIEGALGGTINMTTVRPLELDEPLIALSLDGEYADKTENLAPKFNISAGSNWDLNDAGTFGASVVFAYQDRELRRDEFMNLITPTELDLDGDGISEQANNAGGNFLVRSQNTVEQKTETRERTAYGISLQWAPKDTDGFIYLDINATELDGGQEAYSVLNDSKDYSDLILDNAYGDAEGQLNNFGSGSVFVQPKTWADFTTNESISNALGGEFQVTNKLKISGEISYAKSESLRSNSEFNLRPISREQYDADGTITEHLFTITMTGDGNQVPGISFSDEDALLDPNNLAIRQFTHQRYFEDNEETAIRFDVEYAEPFSNLEFISSIKAGIRTTDREYELDRYDLRNNGSELKNLQTSVSYDGVITPTWVGDFNSAYGGFKAINHSNSFEQSGISGNNALTDYYVYDGALLAYDIDGTYNKVQQMLAGSSHELTGTLDDNMVRNTGSYAKIEEETKALYTQVSLDFGDLSAIIGARYVTTDLTSNTYDQSANHDYSDFLPSINATYNLSDESLVRFAAAKVMRRAEFGELSPALNVDNSLVTGSQGSYQLDPYRVTQYDLSFEHYFSEGGLVSAAIFYKDVNSFTVSSSSCVADSDTVTGQNVTEYVNVCLLDSAGVSQANVAYATSAQDLAYVEGQRDAGLTGIVVNTDVNGGDGEIVGLELAYQQQFSSLPGIFSGLGVSTNYTYADSEQPNGNPLEDISNHTFNAQLYWEHEGYQVRLAYNWRDKYLDTQDEKRVRPVGQLATGVYNRTDPDSPYFDPTLGNNYRDSRGQFDVSASYDINKHITVVANAVNLTGEPIRQVTELGSNWLYSEADRRFTIGVRAKF